jgi:hypothetical protein
MMQSPLGLPGNVGDGLRQTFLPLFQVGTQARRYPVLPRCFHQGAAGWSVAHLGDAALLAILARGVFAGYRRAEGAYLWKPATELKPSPEAWTTFWRTVDAAGVWRWQKNYQNPEVCDGLQWSLRLEHQDRAVRSEGSNAYPGSPGPDYSPTGEFAHFLRSLTAIFAPCKSFGFLPPKVPG